jgi:hypothetical protein
MNKLDRPTLGLDAEYQIETAQNHIEANYWHQLAQMRVPTPSARKAFQKAFPASIRYPPAPKSPTGCAAFSPFTHLRSLKLRRHSIQGVRNWNAG